jgi:hypothetical protein
MMRFLITLLVFLGCATANAQLINIKTSVYFGSDSSKVPSKYKSRISSFADTAKKLSIKGILLRGNTDADADSLYNIRLSKKRVLAVKELLTKAGITDTLIHFDFYGENKPIANNETEKGKQRNRRVDIILSATLIDLSKKINTKEKDEDSLETIEEVKDTCLGDTTFTLPQGTIITMDKCEFLEQDSCGFSITEITTSQSADSLGLNTIDNHQNILVSGGMFTVKTCDNKCLKKPITIYFLIKEGCEPECTMGLYEGSTRGWEASGDAEVSIIDIGKKRYYKVTFLKMCAFKYNFDCKSKLYNLKIKLPWRFKLLKVKVSNNCPLWVYEKKKISKRKLNMCIPCYGEQTTVFVMALNPKGDTVIVNDRVLANLSRRNQLFAKRCSEPDKKSPCYPKRWLFFGTKKTKIKIRKKDFDKIISSKSN